MFAFHLGYAKSATTFLQKHLFPSIDECVYLGRFCTELDVTEFNWVNEFIFNDNFNIRKFGDTFIEKERDKSKYNHFSRKFIKT